MYNNTLEGNEISLHKTKKLHIIFMFIKLYIYCILISFKLCRRWRNKFETCC